MIRLLASLLLAPVAMSAPLPAAVQPARPAAFASQRIGVTVTGSGPDVVLIPGLSSSPAAWESTVRAVPGYRYHIVHVSGFAGRPAGANASGPVLSPVAEEIARYIREAHLRRPAIVGHSMGGSWAMMIAARHPELAGRVMVVDMMPFMGAMFARGPATPDAVRPVAEQIRQGMLAAAGPARETQAQQTIAGMVRTEALRPVAVRDTLASDNRVSAQGMYDLITTDLTPELRNVHAPMTVLWAMPTGAPISQEQLAGFYRLSYANVPQARVVYVPNSAHFIMWDAPDVFGRELRAFLGAR